jgi:cytochrome c-type biogenesis protein CcsB
MTHFFYILTLALYGSATTLYLVTLVRASQRLPLWAGRFLAVGCVAHFLSTIHLAVKLQHLPLTNLQQSLSLFSLVIMAGFIAFDRRYHVAALGSFVTPIALLMFGLSAVLHGEVKPLPPILQSNWFWIHAVLAFVSYAAFTIAAGVAAMYLLQTYFLKKKHFTGLFQKLPPLDVMDDISYRSLAVGFPLLTIAIISGSIWSEKAIGSYWNWDPKQTWSLITWFIYAALLHGRLVIGWRGKRAAILSIAGFLVLLITFLGMKHSINW